MSSAQGEAPRDRATPEQDQASVGKKIARSVMTTAASQIGVVVANFVTSISQARLLGAEGRGDVTRFVNASALTVLYCGLGIGSGITYFFAKREVDLRGLSRILPRLFALTFALMAAGVAVAASSELRRFLPHGLTTGRVVLALVLFFTLSQVSGWLTAMLSARGRFIPINITTVVVSMTGAVASALLFALRPPWANAPAIIALLVGLEALRVALLSAFAWPALRQDAATAPPPAPSAAGATATAIGAGQVLRYSVMTYSGEILSFLTYRLDMWVVDAYRGAADLGRYSLAVSLAQLVWIVPSASARVLFPYSAMITGREGALLAWRAARISLLIAGGVAACGFVGSHLFLTALFGHDFAQVPALLSILLLGVVPYSLVKVLANYLAGIGAPRTVAQVSLATLVVTAICDFTLIPAWGATGAAWATVISYCACTVLILVLFIRRSPLAWRDLLARSPR